MLIACICGGVLEILGVLGFTSIVTALSAYFTNRYNKKHCKCKGRQME